MYLLCLFWPYLSIKVLFYWTHRLAHHRLLYRHVHKVIIIFTFSIIIIIIMMKIYLLYLYHPLICAKGHISLIYLIASSARRWKWIWLVFPALFGSIMSVMKTLGAPRVDGPHRTGHGLLSPFRARLRQRSTKHCLRHHDWIRPVLLLILVRV